MPEYSANIAESLAKLKFLLYKNAGGILCSVGIIDEKSLLHQFAEGTFLVYVLSSTKEHVAINYKYSQQIHHPMNIFCFTGN